VGKQDDPRQRRSLLSHPELRDALQSSSLFQVEDELPANLLELLKRLDEISEGKKSNPDILAQAHQSLKTGAAIGAYAKGAMGGTSRDHANESLAASRSEDDRQQDHRKSD
jgi:hypothetical protein